MLVAASASTQCAGGQAGSSAETTLKQDGPIIDIDNVTLPLLKYKLIAVAKASNETYGDHVIVTKACRLMMYDGMPG